MVTRQKAFELLSLHYHDMDRQNFRTLWGMVKEGRQEEAMKGMRTILEKKRRRTGFERY